MCLGHGSQRQNHSTPELESHHLQGISFSKAPYVMPWAIYSIAPATLQQARAVGELTQDGKRLVQKELVKLLG